MATHNVPAGMFGSLDDPTLSNNFFGGEDLSPTTDPSPASAGGRTTAATAGDTSAGGSGNNSPGGSAGSRPLTAAGANQSSRGDSALGIAGFYPGDSNWGFNDTPPYDYESANPFDGLYTPVGGQFPGQPWPIQSGPSVGAAQPQPQFANPQQQLAQGQMADGLPRPDQLPAAAISPITLEADSSLSFMPFEVAQQPGHVRPNPSAQTLQHLTPAQQQALKNIAMPAHLLYQSPKSEPSPQSSPSDKEKGDSVSSPEAMEPSKAGSRKRKSSADEDDDDEEDIDGQPVKKTAHNMIEKRYRTNLNDKIAALRDSVPSLRIMSKSARGEDTSGDREELHGLTPAHKLNKATVLSKATEYIRHLEKRNTRLMQENDNMQQRISAFEKLFMHGAMNGAISPLQQPPTPVQFPQDVQAYMNSPMGTPGSDPQGMIQVPEDMKRIIQAQLATGRPYPIGPQANFQQNASMLRQQQIQQQQQQIQQGRWGESGPYFGKLMVGSLAGLMIFEAVRENERSNETPDGRGLFALPLHLLGSLTSSSTQFGIAGYYFSGAQALSTLKFMLLLASLVYAFLPAVYDIFSPKHHKTKQQRQQTQTQLMPGSTSLAAVPSLASPIQVRRQAWLTSIQTVWVPRHNFLLETAALVLKTMKLSLRNTIGIRGYQMLTGLTEDQETARVKAWTIALDAQLAGGDVEINASRLWLTLLASGTLPDTPLRLMLKALHIRVLFWQWGKGCFGAGSALTAQGFNILAAKIARYYWSQAKQSYKLGKASSPTSPATAWQDDDGLPEHLGVLLEQECDDVLNEEVVQRAHNLAWNRPTTHELAADIDGMNAVVEDPAIKSPMDAVAAWWSSLILHQALTASLTTHGNDTNKSENSTTPISDVETDLPLAVRAAPIGSNAQVRAIVARAFLAADNRSANIVEALEAMDPSCNPDKYPEYSRGVPPLIDSPATGVRPIYPDPDAKMALHCAMVAAHLNSPAPKASALALVDKLLRGSTDGLTLLGFSAAFRLIVSLHRHPVAAETCSGSIERVSGALRVWIGGPSSDRCVLDQTTRHDVVQRCLAITKSVVGMETDPGYGSMSDESESAAISGEEEDEDDSC